jgi:hypothetical protein
LIIIAVSQFEKLSRKGARFLKIISGFATFAALREYPDIRDLLNHRADEEQMQRLDEYYGIKKKR